MTLAELLAGVRLESPLPPELAPVEISGIEYDSKA